MKALVLEKPGDASELKIIESQIPEILPNEVLVKVKAVSINPADAKLRSGNYPNLTLTGSEILGWDMSGVIEKIGSEVTKFGVGDEVFGMIAFPQLGHTYAEFVSAPEDQIALKPQNISFESAAASTLAALTAYQTTVVKANVQQGEKVFVHAGSGGVGHFAIQIAKSLGAYVISSSSAANKDFVLDLGADEFFDYQNDSLEKYYRKIDYVLEPLGSKNIEASLPLLRPGGRLITILHGLTEEHKKTAEQNNATADFHLVKTSGTDMQAIADLLENGKLMPHIHRLFNFSEMPEAHRQIETGRTVGKVVISGV